VGAEELVKRPKVKRIKTAFARQVVRLPAPDRVRYEVELPEVPSDIRVFAAPGQQLCVRKEPDGSVVVWTRRYS
jgi:hypothetical protein